MPNFSLSGLKTALRLEAEKIAPLDRAGRRRFVRLVPAGGGRRRARPAARRPAHLPRANTARRRALVAAGGVAANQAIRKVLHRVAFEAGTVLVAPPLELCTDNGAMIAWAGAERLALWPDRYARRGAARALAARRDRGGQCAAQDGGIQMSIERIAVLGGGAWGTALAETAARAGRKVTLWEYDAGNAEHLRRSARANFCPASRSMTRSR